MPIKQDIKYVIRDFIGVNGGEVRLKEGETYGTFIRNKKLQRAQPLGNGEVHTESEEKKTGEGQEESTN